MFTVTSEAEEVSRALDALPNLPVVAVPIYNSFEAVSVSVDSLCTHTPTEVPILLVDDGSSDAAGLASLERRTRRRSEARPTFLLRKSVNEGFVATANLIFRLARHRDVVLVNSDVEVAATWYERLMAVARSSNTLASVSCLTNHGAILSVPERNRPLRHLPAGQDVERMARLIGAGSAQLRPRIPTAVGHCVYFHRLALNAVGDFSDRFSPGYGEEVDWSQRAVAMGFEHALADDVFVFHRGGESFGTDPAVRERQRRNDALVNHHYPYYLRAIRDVAEDRNSPLAAALLAARRSALGISVAVDGLCLGRSMTGTQKVVLELTCALAADPRVRCVELLVPDPLADYARAAVMNVPKVVLRPAVVGRSSGEATADVAVRPYQFGAISELRWLEGWAERLVLLQLDFIAYDNPSYFSSFREWDRYRATQRLALGTADGVGFISATIRRAAWEAHLLSESTPSAVVYPGALDTRGAEVSAMAPRGTGGSVPPGFLLQLGVAFEHKNRLFTLRLAGELWKRGWQGQLVLAGPEPSTGSSVAAEGDWVSRHPEFRNRVTVLGAVSEAEKLWLYSNAGLVLYPTLSEGFGLVPFEAAERGVPCLSTRQGSLDEVLPRDLLTLRSLDPVEEADSALAILNDCQLAQEMVAMVRRRAADFTWEAAGSSLADLLFEVTGRPRNPSAAVRWGRASVGLDGLSATGWTRRVLDPMADRARGNEMVRQWLLPVGTRRGSFSRNLYHRLARDL